MTGAVGRHARGPPAWLGWDPQPARPLDALLRPEELEWRNNVRQFVTDRVLPVIDEDFERGFFRHELVPELGALGVLLAASSGARE